MPMPINLHYFTNGSPNLNSLPYRPTSSLTLAISAILALIPLPQSSSAVSNQDLLLRRSRADLFATAACAEVDNELERITRTASQTNRASGDQMSLNGNSRSYPILSLSILSVYEYCQRGSVSRMRSRANQAVATAMDLSLHSLDITSTEADRRAWWGAVSPAQ